MALPQASKIEKPVGKSNFNPVFVLLKMRKIAANYIFPVTAPPIKNGILLVDGKKIVDIIAPKNKLRESENIEFYNGVLVPGFVNTHCHLELSYLKNKITPGKGLCAFIEDLGKNRNEQQEKIVQNMLNADKELRNNGVVLVGDISNSAHSFHTKFQSDICYHTFIEIFGLQEDIASRKISLAKTLFDKWLVLKQKFPSTNDSISFSPHAPYSISDKLFRLLNALYPKAETEILSIHNQETEAENELFISGKGRLPEFFARKGIDTSCFQATGKTSLEAVIKHLPTAYNTLLVHNTYSSCHDIDLAARHFKAPYFVFCPNANLFIENKLPDVALFRKFSSKIALGTDSLASNSKLSIFDELQTIHKAFPDVGFSELLSWATINGAKALKKSSVFGSFEKGKSPGINLITNFDFRKMQVSEKSRVKPMN